MADLEIALDAAIFFVVIPDLAVAVVQALDSQVQAGYRTPLQLADVLNMFKHPRLQDNHALWLNTWLRCPVVSTVTRTTSLPPPIAKG